MSRRKVIILGKLPPPQIGTSVWFETLVRSELNSIYDICWFNVNVHKDFTTFKKKRYRNIISNLKLYWKYYIEIKNTKTEIALIPISQSTIGFLKDSIFFWLSGETKIIVVLHGSNLQNWFNDSTCIIRKYFSLTMHRAIFAVVLGEKLKYIFRPWFAEDHIFVVPNGIYSSIETKSEIDNKSCVIIRYIGNLIKSKGIIELIEAAEILSKSHNDFLIIINGVWIDKKLKLEFENFIRNKGIPVLYEGSVSGNDKFNALLNSDIFVFTPNKPEGLPLVVLEAMSAGLPIISTDQGAITEAVIHGSNGFIVECRRPDLIAQKLGILMDDPSLRSSMGNESRKLYEEKFTADLMIKKYSHIFDSLICE